jgi:hypothetical protein
MRSVGYESKSKILEIEFQSGEVYQYLGVPRTVHAGLLRAKFKRANTSRERSGMITRLGA